MKTITINRFDGGLAEDERNGGFNQFSDVKGFDTTSKQGTLIPFPETEAEALVSGDITDRRLSEVIINQQNTYLTAIGRNSGASPNVFDLFAKLDGDNLNQNWESYTSLSGAGFYRPNSLVYYQNKILTYDEAFAVRQYASGSWSNIGNLNISAYWDSYIVPKPLYHSKFDIVYFVVNTSIRTLDGTTFSSAPAVALPDKGQASSIAEYGDYIAIAHTPRYPGVNATVFLWNGDTSVADFDQTIDFGAEALLIIENIGGTLVGISTNEYTYTPSTTYTLYQTKKIIIRALVGGQAVILQEIEIPSTARLRNFKTTANGKLYFACDNDDTLYCVYKNREGRIVVTKDRFLNNGSAITTLRGITVIGDYLWIGYDTNATSGLFYKTKVTPVYTNTSTYKSLINPSMPTDDRSKLKKLNAVSVAKTNTTGTITLEYSVDGSAFVTVGSSTGMVLKATNESDGEPFANGYEFQFRVSSTGGAEVTELKYNYDILEELI